MPIANTFLVVQIVLNIIVVNINRLCFSGFVFFQCPLVRIESSFSAFPRNINLFSLVCPQMFFVIIVSSHISCQVSALRLHFCLHCSGHLGISDLYHL